jgi:hypothetical protein
LTTVVDCLPFNTKPFFVGGISAVGFGGSAIICVGLLFTSRLICAQKEEAFGGPLILGISCLREFEGTKKDGGAGESGDGEGLSF